MASISTDPRGGRRILFSDANGTRKTLYLGKTTARVADTIRCKVEEVIACKLSGVSWPVELSTWVGNLGDDLAGKLEAVGLIPPRHKSTLGDFLDSFIDKRKAAKPNSLKNYKQAVGKLLDHFGRDVDLRSLTQTMAEEWAAMLTEKHAKAYAGRLVKFARQFFNVAKREKLLTENAFDGIKAQGQSNESRKFFVTLDVASQVLDACPDYEWRLIFALARFGGLRCPSEILTLKWADVDWAKSRMLVHAPKTEHHDGNGDRMVPIFPELRPYLEEAFERAEDGAVYAITRNRGAEVNFRTHMHRIIKRAGLTPWDKTFQNCRATRETELAAKFPIHVVCAWIGNTQRIAAKHYLQVTEDNFEQATATDANSDALTTQKTTRHVAAPSCTEEQISTEAFADCGLVQDGAGLGRSVQCTELHPTGVEIPHYSLGNSAKCGTDDAESDALSSDPDLDHLVREILEANPPDAIRRAIRALIASTLPGNAPGRR